MSEEYNKLLVGYQELQAQVKELEAERDRAIQLWEPYVKRIEELEAQYVEMFGKMVTAGARIIELEAENKDLRADLDAEIQFGRGL